MTNKGVATDGSTHTSSWTEEEVDFTRDIFSHIASFTALTFEELHVSSAADIVLQKVMEVPGGSYAYAFFPNNGWSTLVIKGQYLNPIYNVAVHEIGHALGLSHPFDSVFVLPGVISPYDYGTFGLNNDLYTTMTYRLADIHGIDEWFQPTTERTQFMALDIAALQAKYGANTTFNSGNNSYPLPSGNIAIWDTGGQDAIDFTQAQDPAVIDLRAATLQLEDGGGGFASYSRAADGSVSGAYTIAYGVQIEQAMGGWADDRLTGNDADNRLKGNAGNDRLFGQAGNDHLQGGVGDDHLFGGVGDDLLELGSGTNVADGQDGSDVVRYAVARQDATVLYHRDGTITVSTPDSSDTLLNIEEIQLSDGKYRYDLFADQAVAAYKLYGGALNRAPDEDGLLYWLDDWLGKGKSLLDVAELFVGTDEFTRKHGPAISNETFVDQLYQSMFDREAEAQGKAYWIAHLANGTLSRGEVLLQFTQLDEYSTAISQDLINGMWLI